MSVKKILYVILGCIGVGLGAVGAVLHLLPAFPFLLLAAFCFARSSEKLNNWFINTRLYKENLENYVQGKGMTRKTKVKIMVTATILMSIGFAAGVMVAASVWSLLIPAMEQASDMGNWAFLPAAEGFWMGILFLLILNRTIPHLHQNSGEPEGPRTRLKRTTMLVLAVTLHNIPEGILLDEAAASLEPRARRRFNRPSSSWWSEKQC